MEENIIHSVQDGNLELFVGVDKYSFEESYFIGIGNDLRGEANSINLTFEQIAELIIALNTIVCKTH